MNAHDLLAEVTRHGGSLMQRGDKLRVEADQPLPPELMALLRQHKAELLRLLSGNGEVEAPAKPSRMRTDYFDGLLGPAVPTVPTPQNQGGVAANPHEHGVAPLTPPEKREAEKSGAGRVLFTNYGAGYRHPDGRVETGQPEPTPRPTEPWPADLNAMLRRVATAFEWTDTDRRDFIAWARRSPEGLADAREFLTAEAARLPLPGLTDRRRVVLDMLAADPSIRYAWTCADDGADPVRLILAIRGAGTCELAIPRAKFDALALPMLIGELARVQP